MPKLSELRAACEGSNENWDDFRNELRGVARATRFLWDGLIWNDALHSTARSEWVELATLPFPEIFILTFSHIDTRRERSVMIRSAWTMTEALLHIQKRLQEAHVARPYSFKMGLDNL